MFQRFEQQHPWKMLWHEAGYLHDWFLRNEISCVTKYNSIHRFCFEVERFQIWPYWRPLTIQKFEQLTIDYYGPHCPILASRLAYREDELVVWEGFDFNMRKNHRYRMRPSFYFVIPEFLLFEPWPSERRWTWQPAVKVSQAKVREILRLELSVGGWPRNRRGIPLVPKQTGWAGKLDIVEPGQGWATMDSLSLTPVSPENLDLFDAEQIVD